MMTWSHEILLIGAFLMLGGILLGAFSSRLGIPFLLVFLIVGMLAGEDGPGRIVFDDTRLGFLVGNLALAIILLDGGLRTRFATFRVALAPSLALATAGVLLTAGLVGLLATLVFGVDWRLGLLIGAVVGSTDAAAVFALMKSGGVRLNERVANTLEIESGVNDPMAVFLTIALIELIASPQHAPVLQLAMTLLQQFGIGALVGLSLGWLLGRGLQAAGIAEGLQALLVSAGGVTIFALTNMLDGSGFLAVYLAGLVIGNGRPHVSENVMRAMDGFAWLSQSGMFLLLGLLVTPHELVPLAVPTLVIGFALMFLIRPLVVWFTLLPFGFSRRESLFIGWVGLRGAVPIVLALFPLLAGVPGANLVFNAAFVVVLTSLLVQGTTVSLAASRLGVQVPSRAQPRSQMPIGQGAAYTVEFVVRRGAPLEGAAVATLQLPPQVAVTAVVRDGQALGAVEAGALRAGDSVAFITSEHGIERLAELFTPAPRDRRESPRSFYGEFELDASVPIGDLCSVYAPNARPVDPARSIADEVRAQMPRAVEGDTVSVHGMDLTVREISAGRIERVGLHMPRHAPPTAPPSTPSAAAGSAPPIATDEASRP